MGFLAISVASLALAWGFLNAGGEPLALEALIIAVLWLETKLALFFNSSPCSISLGSLLSVFSGVVVFLLYYFLRGKGSLRYLRIAILNLAVITLLLGDSTVPPLSADLHLSFCSSLFFLLYPLIFYSLLLHTRLGVSIRAVASAPDLMTRFKGSPLRIQMMAFALLGAFLGLLFSGQGPPRSAIVGFGYLAYFILFLLRRTVAFALKSLKDVESP